jgi:general stress protein YciG
MDDMDHPASENLGKQMTVSEAGRRGGYATLQNRGTKHFQKIGRKGGKRTAQLYRELLSGFGKRGGRPRRPNLEESMGGGEPVKKEAICGRPLGFPPPPHFTTLII